MTRMQYLGPGCNIDIIIQPGCDIFHLRGGLGIDVGLNGPGPKTGGDVICKVGGTSSAAFIFWQHVARKLLAFLAMAKSSNVKESNVRAAMESAVSGLQSALTRVSTMLTQLQTGGRSAAEENRTHRTAGRETAEQSRSGSIHRAAGRETAERSRSDSDDDFESRPKKRYVISPHVK